MEFRKPKSLITLSFVLPVLLLLSGCSDSETNQETGKKEFQAGTLSSNEESEATTAGNMGGSSGGLLVRVDGAKNTRFSGLCSVGEREYVISGKPSKTYSFEEDQSFSCRIKKRDSNGGNLKVTVVSGDSTRSVQQTNAQGRIVNVSNDNGDSG